MERSRRQLRPVRRDLQAWRLRTKERVAATLLAQCDPETRKSAEIKFVASTSDETVAVKSSLLPDFSPARAAA